MKWEEGSGPSARTPLFFATVCRIDCFLVSEELDEALGCVESWNRR